MALTRSLLPALSALVAASAAAPAHAAPVTLCVKAGHELVAPASGTACPTGHTPTRKASDADHTAVKADLAAALASLGTQEAKLVGVSRTPTTLRISGVNLQLDNGAGSTTARNGRGNLIVGYNEVPGSQTGSHNLIVGPRHTATGYAGLLSGYANKVTGGYGTALGYATTASGGFAVAAGDRNLAAGERSVALGGSLNQARGLSSSITGGMLGKTLARWSAITGGCANHTDPDGAGSEDRLPACVKDPATGVEYDRGEFAAVLAGSSNLASAPLSVVSGGFLNLASGFESAVSGGSQNTAAGPASSVSGGQDNETSGEISAISGGARNKATGDSSSVSGGELNDAAGLGSSILGGYEKKVVTQHGLYPAGT